MQLRHSDPGSFWKRIKYRSAENNSAAQSVISLDMLYPFFRTQCETSVVVPTGPLDPSLQPAIPILDDPITEIEVADASRRLRALSSNGGYAVQYCPPKCGPSRQS